MYNGGCECKSVRYQFNGKPMTCYACHCTDCQTVTGSAFALSMLVHEHDLHIIEGEIHIRKIPDDRIEIRRHECKGCGTVMWFSADAYPNMAALKPGTLDDTHWFTPIAHLWTRSAQPWIKLDSTAKQYETQAKFSELVELWANHHAK